MGLSTPTIGNGCGKLRRCAPDVKKLPHLGNWVYNRITIGIMLICMRKSCLLLSNSIWKNGSHWDFYSKPSHEMNPGGEFFGRGNIIEKHWFPRVFSFLSSCPSSIWVPLKIRPSLLAAPSRLPGNKRSLYHASPSHIPSWKHNP